MSNILPQSPISPNTYSKSNQLTKSVDTSGYYIVSVTSQGQISIPAKIRRKLGLNKRKKAWVTMKGDQIVIEPIRDFLELGGSLKTRIKATPRQIRESFGQYLAKEAVKGIK